MKRQVLILALTFICFSENLIAWPRHIPWTELLQENGIDMGQLDPASQKYIRAPSKEIAMADADQHLAYSLSIYKNSCEQSRGHLYPDPTDYTCQYRSETPSSWSCFASLEIHCR